MKVYELTAHELGDMYRKKQISVPEATSEMLKRIAGVDGVVESYLTVCGEEAMESAKKTQEKFDRGSELPPLAGIPAAIKDNICTKGVKTTCASKILYNFIPPYDATVMERLKEADTVILGKTNMDEFAMGSSTENSRFKITKNPWDLERVPGGSSGGSASSVAASTSMFALGSDTGGSVRQPSALCGVVGLKPTYGAVSRYGLVAFASSLDQIGPITKDVEDSALVMNVISGHDSMDSTSVDRQKEDYTKALVNDVKGMKIGLPKEYFADGVDTEIKESVMNAVKLLESLGASVGECSLPMTKYAIPAYYVLATSEASSNLARFDGVKYGFRAEKFEDLGEMYRETRSEGFGNEVKRRIILGTYALSSGYYDAYYKKALQVRTLIKQGFDTALENFDVVLGPTTPSPAFKIGEKVNDPITMYLEDIFTVPANIGGVPGISIPCGFTKSGLPIGMQIVAKAFNENALLRVGYTYQKNTEFHKKRTEI